ncbi:MAG: sulfatase-like hydrolase/transferase [Pirellulales bacterium]
MAEIFKRRGYRTGHFGKWHLGDSYPNLPHQRGFEETVYHLGWGITSMADTWLNDCFDGRFFHNGKLHEYPGYCTDVFFDLNDEVHAGTQSEKSGRSSSICRPTLRTARTGCDPKYRQPYRGQGPAEFFGMIANLDENLGRLDKFLEEKKLVDEYDHHLLQRQRSHGGRQFV